MHLELSARVNLCASTHYCVDEWDPCWATSESKLGMFMGLAGIRQTTAKGPSEMHLSQPEKGTSFCQLKKQTRSTSHSIKKLSQP